MNLMQRGAAWLGKQLKANAGVWVVYKPDDQNGFLATATLAETWYEVAGDGGALTRVLFYDWIFQKAQLRCITPKRSDYVIYEGKTYMVLPVDDERDCVEPVDGFGEMVKVHTKLIKDCE